jgi:hypothetical protein
MDAYTRLEPGAAVLLIFTRWHGDDLAAARSVAFVKEARKLLSSLSSGALDLVLRAGHHENAGPRLFGSTIQTRSDSDTTREQSGEHARAIRGSGADGPRPRFVYESLK